MAEHRRRRSWFGRGRTRALLSTGLLLGTGAVATSAYWNAQATVSGGTINSGAMHIDLAGSNQVKPESITWASLPGQSLADLTPGTTRSATVMVKNNSIGQVRLSFNVTASATNTAGTQLAGALRVKAMNAPCSGTGNTVPAGGTIGTTVTLAQGASQSICLLVTLPTGTSVPNGSKADLTFAFPATQVP